MAIKLTPLVAPFTDDGSSLSEVRISRLIRRWVERGSEGFFLNGDAGEFMCLSSGERKYMVEVVLRDSFAAIPVIVNISSLSTSKSLDLSQHAARHGARAGFLTPPYYGNYNAMEIGNHIRTVVSFSNLPVILADPNGVITEEVEPHLENLPRLTRANLVDWDEWTSEEYEVSARATFASVLGEPSSPEHIRVIHEHGISAVMKAAYERDGLDLGFPRSPRASVAGSDLAELLTPKAA